MLSNQFVFTTWMASTLPFGQTVGLTSSSTTKSKPAPSSVRSFAATSCTFAAARNARSKRRLPPPPGCPSPRRPHPPPQKTVPPQPQQPLPRRRHRAEEGGLFARGQFSLGGQMPRNPPFFFLPRHECLGHRFARLEGH